MSKYMVIWGVVWLSLAGGFLYNELYYKFQPDFAVGDCVAETYEGGEFTKATVSPFVKKIKKIGNTHYLYSKYFTFVHDGQPRFTDDGEDDMLIWMINDDHIKVPCRGL